MKSLDINAMGSAVKNVISLCGIGILADSNRFQSAILDFMQGASLNTELQLLMFTVRTGVGKKLLKGVNKSAGEQKQILVAAYNVLNAEFGFSESRSADILEAFVLALGWNKEDIPKSAQPVSDVQKMTVTGEGQEQQDIVEGEVIKFGKYKWRILCVKKRRALLIADEITDVGIPYNNFLDETSWEESQVRRWLNTEFLQRFSHKQQGRIATRRICAERNPWYQTDAGCQTEDKVFLLSIEEVVRSFGDSGQLKSRPEYRGIWGDPENTEGLSRAIDDEYNDKRQAAYNGERTWWWLRSPGDSKYKAAYVNADGVLILNGELVSDDGGPSCAENRPGIRPAIWLRI